MTPQQKVPGLTFFFGMLLFPYRNKGCFWLRLPRCLSQEYPKKEPPREVVFVFLGAFVSFLKCSVFVSGSASQVPQSGVSL